MEEIEKILERNQALRIIKAIEASGCVIVNPNYNPVKGMENGLILRSADKDWLVGTILEILEYKEKE